MSSTPIAQSETVRIDKWLWAARFFKTRALAKHAIETGKISHKNMRIKVSKVVTVGMELNVKQGFDLKTIIVLQKNAVRGNAKLASLMYLETPESISSRLHLQALRALNYVAYNTQRPTKKDRRKIIQFTQIDHCID